jgi:peptide/nickel transport system permease protein
MKLLRRFFSRWQNVIAFVLILVFVGTAIFAPILSPDDTRNPGPFMVVGKVTEGEPQPPSEEAVLGTLPHGIDVYHALIWGTRDALKFGLTVTILTALFGTFYGALAGIFSRRTGGFLMSIADSFLAFPAIAGVVLLQQLFAATVTAAGGMYFNSQYFGKIIEIKGPVTLIQTVIETFNPLMLSLIVFSWMAYARLVYSIVLTLRETEFIHASRALGASLFWVIRRHLMPNSTSPAMVLAARDVGGVVLLQATLTFINIGGESVWGAMLALGRNWILGPGGSLLTYWWVFLPPTLAVMMFGIAWYMFGDGLSDVFDPRAL